jgi:LPS sulfotransferase NodH
MTERSWVRNLGGAEDPVRFVILGTQRTGTILLMGLLDSHPEIACTGELFQHKADQVQHSVPRYRLHVTSSLKNRILHLAARRRSIQGYLDDLFTILDAPVVGFKLMLDQAQRFPAVLDYLKAHDFKVIHIVRQNLLKTYISRLRARQTGVYLSTESPDKVLLHVPVDSLVHELAALEREQETLQDVVSRLSLDSFTVSYESIASRLRESELRRLLLFLGVDPDMHLEPRSTKITPDDLGEAIANYEEVVTTLTDTAYQRFLS